MPINSTIINKGKMLKVVFVWVGFSVFCLVVFTAVKSMVKKKLWLKKKVMVALIKAQN